MQTSALCPAGCAREATEALAVHHEHRARDLEAARTFALQSFALQATAELTRNRWAPATDVKPITVGVFAASTVEPVSVTAWPL